jgi:hypothetical protein
MAVEDSEEFGQQPKLDRYDNACSSCSTVPATAPRSRLHLHVARYVLVTARRTRLTALEASHDHTVADP